MSKWTAKYPIYIPSKNRADTCLTARFFLREGVKFKIVIEPSQVSAYRKNYADDLLLVLPRDEMLLVGARLWIREHSIAAGFDRHWQFDDNIRDFQRLHKGKRIPVDSNIALHVAEEFTDRYNNIGLTGFNYTMFTKPEYKQPYFLNVHVYSATLVNNRMPFKWRLKYNDDTDLCLQVLTNNLCTVLFNVFCVRKLQTMAIKGGNTDDLYAGDGRFVMARTLEEMWPEHVVTTWRFGRPQHLIKNNWHQFTTPLIRRTDIDWSAIENTRFDIALRAVKKPRSRAMRRFLAENG